MFGEEATVVTIQVIEGLESLLLVIGAVLAMRGLRQRRGSFPGFLASGLILLALSSAISVAYNWWLLGPGRPITEEAVENSVYLSNDLVLATQFLSLEPILKLV